MPNVKINRSATVCKSTTILSNLVDADKVFTRRSASRKRFNDCRLVFYCTDKRKVIIRESICDVEKNKT